MLRSLVGSEMCIRDSIDAGGLFQHQGVIGFTPGFLFEGGVQRSAAETDAAQHQVDTGATGLGIRKCDFGTGGKVVTEQG